MSESLLWSPKASWIAWFMLSLRTRSSCDFAEKQMNWSSLPSYTPECLSLWRSPWLLMLHSCLEGRRKLLKWIDYLVDWSTGCMNMCYLLDGLKHRNREHCLKLPFFWRSILKLLRYIVACQVYCTDEWGYCEYVAAFKAIILLSFSQ